jgi:succinate dehydrogenase/fumarate reductase iron-sulfur protein
MIEISVQRFDPESDRAPRLQTFAVPAEEGGTVLGALQYIYETYDSTLAFRYGCRNTACGLCAMDIGGKPALACTTTLAEGMVVRSLPKLPLARDLVLDRRWIMPFLKRFELAVPQSSTTAWPGKLDLPPEHARLAACSECLICLANCPHYQYEEGGRGGPYHFVKLGQMHWDPRNTIDRRAQAAQLGIERCAACRKCRCPFGVPIYRAAIQPLLGG